MGDQIVPLATGVVPEESVPQEHGKLQEFASKNVFSERKRREEMNKLLYSLRVLVPKISKMDKASILADAIDYVKELTKEVDSVQSEIQSLTHSKKSSERPVTEKTNSLIIKPALRRTEQVLEVDARLVEATSVIDLRIHCKREAKVLFQLSRVAESLPFPLKGANFNDFGEDLVVNFILQPGPCWLLTNKVDARQMIMDALSKQGFSFVLAGDRLRSHDLE